MDKETIEAYDVRIEDYVRLIDRKPDKALKSFTKQILKNGLVLDLGCGPGNAAYFMESCGLRTDPTDASEEMVKLANEKFGLSARIMSFSELMSIDVYDGVWANFSLLHARKVDFPKHLKAIFASLKPGGVFSLGMKLGHGEKRDKLGRFYAYYTRSELFRILKAMGFILHKAYEGQEKGLVGKSEPWIVIQLKKGKV